MHYIEGRWAASHRDVRSASRNSLSCGVWCPDEVLNITAGMCPLHILFNEYIDTMEAQRSRYEQPLHMLLACAGSSDDQSVSHQRAHLTSKPVMIDGDALPCRLSDMAQPTSSCWKLASQQLLQDLVSEEA